MTPRQGCSVILLDGSSCPAPVTHRRWRVSWRHELGREPLCKAHFKATEAQAGPVPDGAGGWKMRDSEKLLQS